MYLKAAVRLNGMCTPRLDHYNKVLIAPNGDRMKTLCTKEVDVSIGTTNLLAFDLSGLGFWMF
jgi:hypothetical protein